MKVVDLNVLLYAVNADAPQHARARRWWEAALNGEEQIGLTWPVLLGFLRLTTRAGLIPRPLTPRQALETVDAWLSHPLTTVLQPGDDHWAVLRRLLDRAGVAGNLTTDAHLAAVVLEYGATLVTSDADFARFPELETANPLA
jgi:toxin-antitoxin system PIN domain toxin